jgi:hypothetical protein
MRKRSIKRHQGERVALVETATREGIAYDEKALRRGSHRGKGPKKNG